MSSLLKKIIAIAYDIFTKEYTHRIVLPGNESVSEPVGGAIEVSLLKKIVEVMDDPVDSFEHGGMSYHRDPEFAGRTFNVYVRNDGEVFMLHSPTDPGHMEDIMADVALALNFRTRRVKDEVYDHIAAEQKYLKMGVTNITTVGYSLGAFVSEDTLREGSQAKEVFLISRPITFINFRYILPSGTFSIKSILDPVGLLSLFFETKSVEKQTNLKPEVKSVSDFIREHLAGKILSRLESLGVTKVGSIVESKEAEAYDGDDEGSEPLGGLLGQKLKEREKAQQEKKKAKYSKADKDEYEKMTVVAIRSQIGLLKKELAIPRSDFVITGKIKPELIQMLKDLHCIKADAQEH